jgi:sorting nexin-1/2
MSNDRDDGAAPPDFEADDPKNDDPMFVSAMSPGTVEISLDGGDDDEEENPFVTPTPASIPKTPTSAVPSYVDDVEKTFFQQDDAKVPVDEDDDDPFGEKKTSSKPPPSPASSPVPKATPEPQPSTPVKQQSQFYTGDLNAAPPSPSRPSTYESQSSSSTSVSKADSTEKVVTTKPVQKRSSEDVIEITVSDPTKVGDGMSSYMTYRITTKTTLSIFTKPEFSVNRRFSDFLGLHTKLVQKHLHLGIIVPSPPEKDSMHMAKVKISKDESSTPADFVDRRRALLERYLNRIAKNDKLLEDSDVREFLELPTDLPKSKDTQALSGAGVLRVFSNISNSVTKLSTKTGEQDQWFEEKHTIIVDLQTHLKHLYNQFNTLFSQRKEAGHVLKQFSTSLNHLATVEEHTSLSSALTELANLEEKLEQIHSEYSLKEYSVLTELIKEYISLLDMIQLAFNERIKIHQVWLNSEETLRKKREAKTKLELTPKGLDKIPAAELEIRDWEGKVEHAKEDFERISTTIKEEMEIFEQTRIDDFKTAIDHYLKNLLEQQEKTLQLWEGYLPEADKITV